MLQPETPQVLALAIDVDGTLLDPNHEVTAASREAIGALKAAGVLPVITTSRPPAAIAALQELLDLADRPAVTCQGAIWGTRDVTGAFHARSARPIRSASARQITEIAEARSFGVSWFSADQWFARFDDGLVDQEERITGTTAERVATLLDDRRPPNKILVMAQPGHESELAAVQAVLPSDVVGATSRSDYLEIVAVGVSKWSALQEVYAWRQIPLDRTAAVGDGNNDFEMITNSAVGIAMGHAPVTLRQAADWIAPDNSHEGFASAVRWLLTVGATLQ
jgi:Cof subfamily protein (haloacid dehalogenase superfamily)